MRRIVFVVLIGGCTTGPGAADAGFCESSTPAVTLATLASGAYGDQDGPLDRASFGLIGGLAFDLEGRLVLSDTSHNRIRRVTAEGRVETIAGNGHSGFRDGSGGANGTAEFNAPVGVAVSPSGSVLVADSGNHRIREIDAASNVTTLAGNGNIGQGWGSYADGSGGPNGTAEFGLPRGLALDDQGYLYVADGSNARVRKIDSTGATTTLCGNGTDFSKDGSCLDGTASFGSPYAVHRYSMGGFFVADGNFIRQIDGRQQVTTIAGGDRGWVDGPGSEAQFDHPRGIALDRFGNIYVADTQNRAIRKIGPDGAVTTVVVGKGDDSGAVDGAGGCEGPARILYPLALTFGPDGLLYVADGHLIRTLRFLP